VTNEASYGHEDDAENGPGALLWAALSHAPSEGIPVPDLMAATGMSRRWVYYRLRQLADAGRAEPVAGGNWRAIDAEPNGDNP
jgi:S-DNA-T family DNA segregation ATPase FtsK/SpoIIIE